MSTTKAAFTNSEIVRFFVSGLSISDLSRICSEGQVDTALRQALATQVRMESGIPTPPYNSRGLTNNLDEGKVPGKRKPAYNRNVCRGDVLRLLNTGSATASDVGSALSIKRGTIKAVLLKCESQGLTVCSNMHWRLTDKGRRYVEMLGLTGKMLAHGDQEKLNAEFPFPPAKI